MEWKLKNYDNFSILPCSDGGFWIEVTYTNMDGEDESKRFIAKDDKHLLRFIRENILSREDKLPDDWPEGKTDEK